MSFNKGLGKGLAALLADMAEEESANEAVLPGPKVTLVKETESRLVSEVDIGLVDPNPNQPRKYFDDIAMRELAQSIKAYGILQPLILVRVEDRYLVVAGERRYRAAKMANLATVPAVIREFTKQQVKEIAIIENLQREDLNPIEAAEAIQELMNSFKLTQEEVAVKIGKSRPNITNTLRLLQLEPEVMAMVRTGRLSAGHARALVIVNNAKEQLRLANDACDNKMSVRDLETQVKLFVTKGASPSIVIRSIKEKQSTELKALINDMKRIFGTKVKALGNDSKGRICIDYFSNDDLQRIFDLVQKLK